MIPDFLLAGLYAEYFSSTIRDVIFEKIHVFYNEP